MSNRILYCIFITVCASICIGWIGGWNRAMKAGNQAYSRGDYHEAQTAFQQATRDKPENPIAHYNLGTTLYRLGKFREATRTFQASLSKHTQQTEDTLTRAHILYNLGNAQFKLGDLTGAIESYEQTLRIDPQDTDAQHNLALARHRLKEQEALAQQQTESTTASKTEPNDMGKAEALRLLERFSQNENRLRQKLQKQQRKSGYRREKDW